MQMRARAPTLTVKAKIIIGIGVTVGFLVFFIVLNKNTNNSAASKQASTGLGAREGEERFPFPPWRTDKTIAAKTLVENHWIRVEDHTIRLETKNGTEIIPHWKWVDIADQVNVLVSQEDESGKEKFLLWEQTKYGLVGETLAVVGGLMEPGEQPFDAAKRELEEEMGFNSCAEWTPLGTFRVDVNRGFGMISCFFARKCRFDPSKPHSISKVLETQKDLEKQRVVRLSQSELARAVEQGKVKEIKWAYTITRTLMMFMSGELK